MLIQCTKKLLDELKVKPEAVVNEELPLFSWHANVITLGRRKTLILSNDQNQYRVVLFGLKAKDFIKLDELIVTAIRKTFNEEGIREEVIDQYLELSKGVVFTKTKNRSMVARLNRACEDVPYFTNYINELTLYQSYLSMKVSTLLVGTGKQSYIKPNEEMYKGLKEMAGGPIFDSKAVVLKVKLKLELHEVYRRLAVPLNFTFAQFHEVLQKAFGWQNEHLHEFYIFDKNGESPSVNIICDEGSLGYKSNISTYLEKDVKLADFIPARMKYIYDFGDHWEHEIVIEKEIDDYDKNHAVCLDAYGNTPPENVGGEGGYEEFLRIINDKMHPDNKYMKEWARDQGYQDKLNIHMINAYLTE